MKKIAPAVLALLLMLCMSVSSLAYCTGSIPGMTKEGNDIRIKTIITSTLTEPQKEFMRLWFAGGGSGKTMLHYENYSGKHDLVFTIIHNKNAYLKLFDVNQSGSRFEILHNNADSLVGRMHFSFDDATKTYKFNFFLDPAGGVFIPVARICGSFNDPLLAPFELDYSGDCLIDDDDGLLENPLSSSSESSSSEAPAPPYDPAPAPSMPSGGSDSPYIPYNPDVWWEAVSFIRSGAGAAGNILFLVLAPFVLVSLALFFVRHYASGGKGGGGGKSI